MKAHERIWKALSHEEPDRIPTFAQSIDPPFVKKFRKYQKLNGNRFLHSYNTFRMRDEQLATAKELGLDAKWKHFARTIPTSRNAQSEPWCVPLNNHWPILVFA